MRKLRSLIPVLAFATAALSLVTALVEIVFNKTPAEGIVIVNNSFGNNLHISDVCNLTPSFLQKFFGCAEPTPNGMASLPDTTPAKVSPPYSIPAETPRNDNGSAAQSKHVATTSPPKTQEPSAKQSPSTVPTQMADTSEEHAPAATDDKPALSRNQPVSSHGGVPPSKTEGVDDWTFFQRVKQRTLLVESLREKNTSGYGHLSWEERQEANNKQQLRDTISELRKDAVRLGRVNSQTAKALRADVMKSITIGIACLDK